MHCQQLYIKSVINFSTFALHIRTYTHLYIMLITGNNNFYETFNDDFHMEPNQLPFEFLFPAGSNLSDSNNKQCFNISAVNDYCTEGNETLQVEIDTDNPLDVVVEIDGNSGGNWSSILAVSVINITIVDADNNGMRI